MILYHIQLGARSFRSLAPLDKGFEAVVVVGQGLGEGEELGDGVVRASETHLDPVAADRDAVGQAGEPAVEGVGGDRGVVAWCDQARLVKGE